MVIIRATFSLHLKQWGPMCSLSLVSVVITLWKKQVDLMSSGVRGHIPLLLACWTSEAGDLQECYLLTDLKCGPVWTNPSFLSKEISLASREHPVVSQWWTRSLSAAPLCRDASPWDPDAVFLRLCSTVWKCLDKACPAFQRKFSRPRLFVTEAPTSELSLLL